ncbi:MAG: FAD-dependent oxidoreductase [Chloracidobacterium sp.]|nr:FAD-dependent oxidoreductase [Chloracidobacterium sp.]
MDVITVIGGGLAGVEAAWQAAEMRAKVPGWRLQPVQQTPAPDRNQLLRSFAPIRSRQTSGSAAYLLKEELRRGGSMVLEVAHRDTRSGGCSFVGGSGSSLPELITERVGNHPRYRDRPRRDIDPQAMACRSSQRAAYLRRTLATEIMKLTRI